MKVIGGVIMLIVVCGAVCIGGAIIGYLAYFIMAGCAIVALVSYIGGAFIVCWWSIGIAVACLIARAFLAAAGGID